MTIEFGEYLPDQPPLDNAGVVTANNVFPAVKGYKPIPALEAVSDALDNYARGAITVKDSTGASFTLAGDEKKLYQLNSTAWLDKSGTPYTSIDGDLWEFVKWKDKVLATNFTDKIQTITIGGASFADLVAEPRARHIAVVRSFVVVGDTFDSSDGNVPFRIRWSAIKDETDWTVAPATLSDFQDLESSGGIVKRIMGGEIGVIFQEKSIWRMTFIGSPSVFQFDEVLPARGTLASGSVIQVGDDIYFLAQDGFYVINNGVQVTPIGFEKVDRTFFADLDEVNVGRMTGASDPLTKRVFWAYPGAGNTGGLPNKVLIYDWGLQKWSMMEDDVELFSQQAIAGTSLDNLDTFALGATIVTGDNSTFASDTGDWKQGGNWAISGGGMTHTP